MKGFNIFTGEKVETKNVAEEKDGMERKKKQITFELPKELAQEALKYKEKRVELMADKDHLRESFAIEGKMSYKAYLEKLDELSNRMNVVDMLLSDKIEELHKMFVSKNEAVSFVENTIYTPSLRYQIERAIMRGNDEVDAWVWM